jgi:tetratricopeptide (TPR) repeat protein
MKKQQISLPDSKPGHQKSFIFILLIVFLTGFSYAPSLKNGFTNWDDPNYVYKNSTIQTLNNENTKVLLTKPHMGNYHPLTMLSLAMDYSLGKLQPKTYHTTNLVLHLANTVLVYIFIFLLLGKIELSLISAALFGVHTLHVESVAWISERKDVLFTFFFLASLILYIKYVKEGRSKFYLYSILLFILSCLSKGMAVSLSLSILAIDYLLGRNLLHKKVIIEKIPFFTLSIFFGIIAIKAQTLGPDTEGIPDYNIFNRLVFASYGTIQYLIKLVLPLRLSAFYPYPDKGSLPLVFWLAPVFVLGTGALVFYFLRKDKVIVFCLLFFLFNIIMVLQILPVGKAIMADRYAYIPSIGFFLLIGILYDRISEKQPSFKIIAISILVIYTGILAIFTHQRCKVWKDSFSLWTDVIEQFNTVGIAYNNRGVAYADLNQYKNSIADYDQAIKIDPKNSEAYNNKGVALAYLKEYNEAIDNYNKAIETRKNYAEAYYNRGNAFISLNDPDKAIQDYNKAVQFSPRHSGALNNRGLAKRMVKDLEGALEDFNTVIKFYPDNAQAYNNRSLARNDLKDFIGAESDSRIAAELDPGLTGAFLQNGDAKALQGDFQAAIVEFTYVVEHDPGNFEAIFKRGKARNIIKEFNGAIADFTGAIMLQPKNPEPYLQRGIAKSSKEDLKGAMEDYNKAIEMNSNYSDAYNNRAILKYNLKDLKGALSDYDKAIEFNPAFVSAYCNRGLLKSNLKDNAGAMTDYNKCIELDPRFAVAYGNRGVLYYNSGNKKAACQDWNIGRDLNDENSKNFLTRFCK